MRQACPFPYADGDDEVTMSCTESQYVNRARGKTVLQAQVSLIIVLHNECRPIVYVSVRL